MLNQLLKFTLVSGLLLWLRRRWKWLLGCGAVIVMAMYLHGEFLDYVEALPPGSEEAAMAGEYVAVTFAVKNVVIFASLLTYFLVEMRATRRNRASRRRAGSRPAPSPSESTTVEGDSLVDDDAVEDGFDFLRHGRKLDSRADKVIGRKRTK